MLRSGLVGMIVSCHARVTRYIYVSVESVSLGISMLRLAHKTLRAIVELIELHYDILISVGLTMRSVIGIRPKMVEICRILVGNSPSGCVLLESRPAEVQLKPLLIVILNRYARRHHNVQIRQYTMWI